jgi:hypothetical protein
MNWPPESAAQIEGAVAWSLHRTKHAILLASCSTGPAILSHKGQVRGESAELDQGHFLPIGWILPS